MSHQESTARTPAAVAADLRELADRLDAAIYEAVDLRVRVTIQPQTITDNDTVSVVDALGVALTGTKGRREEMHNGSYHYDVSGHVGVVSVAVFTGISGPESPEVAALRAELADAKAALAARDSRPQMAMETADPRCPDPECGEALREIEAGLVGHCGRNCAPALVLPDNAVYWRICRNSVGSLFVVCMQWFDEGDYDQSRFLNDLHYATEAAAYKALADAEVSS